MPAAARAIPHKTASRRKDCPRAARLRVTVNVDGYTRDRALAHHMSKTVPLVPDYRRFTPASSNASAAMRRNRRDGGRAEEILRKAVWRRGMRYWKHYGELPGKPDLAFPRVHIVVFCDGDFWHGRHWPRLRAQLLARANSAYWLPKIARNRERDAEQTSRLEQMGWTVLRFWETEVLKDPEAAADVIEATVRSGIDAGPRTRRYNML